MAILEFIISILFICLLISLFTSWAIDLYADWKNRKGELLKKMLKNLLGEEHQIKWTELLYNHPMIQSLSVTKKWSKSPKERLTSSIPSNLFALTITDVILEQTKKNQQNQTPDAEIIDFPKEIESALLNLPEGKLKKSLLLLLKSSNNEKTDILKKIEDWYDDYMLRVNHTYKRTLRLPLWLFGFIIAILFNIDFIRITNELWTDASIRNTVYASAIQFEKTYADSTTIKTDSAFFEKYKEELKLPIGYKDENIFTAKFNKNYKSFHPLLSYLFKLIGYALTGLIASFGAPFWFDALQKIIGLKKAMKLKTEQSSSK